MKNIIIIILAFVSFLFISFTACEIITDDEPAKKESEFDGLNEDEGPETENPGEENPETEDPETENPEEETPAEETPEEETPEEETPNEETPEDPDPPSQTAESRFIAVGGSGTILYSDDYGATWTGATSGNTEVLRDAACDEDGNCVVVGYDGIVLYSEDKGLTWDEGSVQTINHIQDVECYGVNKFVAVGEATGPDPYCIFRTTDGGETWDRRAATVITKGVGVRDNTFVAVGHISQYSEAIAMVTYTAGDQWSYPCYSEPNDFPAGTGILYDVVFANYYYVAVGRDAVVYSNSGGDWNTANTSLPVLYAVTYSATPGRLVAVGGGCSGGPCIGRILYSNSATGSTWTEVAIGTIEYLFDVETDGNGRFAAVGDAGEIVYSIDTGDISESGTQWAKGTSGTSVHLWGIGACKL